MPAKDDFEFLSNLAKEFFGLDGEELEDFVTKGMGLRGHKQVSNWADADDSSGQSRSSGLLGGSSKRPGSGNFQYPNAGK